MFDIQVRLPSRDMSPPSHPQPHPQPRNLDTGTTTAFTTTTKTQTRTMSLQLPDLLSSCNAFELRTNRHCRAVSQASEKWLLESGIELSTLPDPDSGSMTWNDAKHGLLASACHPSVDATQLRFVADFVGVLLHHRERPLLASSGDDAESDMFALLSDRLSRIAYKNPRWYMRFLNSQRGYLEARDNLCRNGDRSVVPDLESYIEVRRDASGLRMALDMVLYAGDVDVPETVLDGVGVFGRLRDYACDIAVWAEDILSFAKGIPGKHEANIVAILMNERNVSIECALSSAGMLVKQSADAFVATEEALLSEPELGNNPEVRRYIRGLRDWIAGFVNWLYETHLFLGEKGNEVRTFGWVFVPVSR